MVVLVQAGAAAGVPSDPPTLSPDATISWEDALFQAKPDGTLMYLVTTQDLLIESSRFTIEAPDGSKHSNLLPWEMKQEIRGGTLRVSEPIRIKGASGRFQVESTVEDPRRLRLTIDFAAEGYRADSATLNLPQAVYEGDHFEVDGASFVYAPADEGAGNRRQVLLSRRPVTEFISSRVVERAFTLRARNALEIEILNAVDWKGHRSYWVQLYSVDGAQVDYSLELPPIDRSALEEAAEPARNVLANSSFELGREEWGVIFGKRDVSSQWSITDETASHGEHSLKVEIVPPTAAFEPDAKNATIASDYFEAKPLDRLTISADFKASHPGQKVKLQLRYVPTALVPNRGSNLIEKELTLTDQWQRYAFDARLPVAAKNAYAIAVAIPDTEEAAEIYLDAVTVSRQGEGSYRPQQRLEARTDTVRYHRVYVPGEAFDLLTRVRNNAAEAARGEVHLTLRNDRGTVLHTDRKEFTELAAHSTAQVAWETPVFPAQGMYRIEVTVGAPGEGQGETHGLSLGVVRARDVETVDPSIRFGANITDLREFWALERIGLGWSRFTFDCAWGNLQPTEGWWNNEHAARLSALLDYQATFGVTPLAVLGPGMPQWASRAPEGSSAFRAYTPKEELKDAFVDYLNRLLDLADGRLFAVETWNEPDIPLFYRGTVEEMAEFTTLVYDTVKAHSPQVEVVGLGLATPAETHNHFLDELLGHTGLDPFDAISFHPYTEGRRHPMRGEFREVVESIETVVSGHGAPPPFWATEFGWFALGHDTKPFVPYKNPFVAREILTEKECAAAYIQAVSTAFSHGTEKAFYFTLLEGNLLDLWLHGWVGPGGRSVESGFIAAAAACDMMYAVECRGQDALGEGSWQTRFSGAKGDFVVLWNETGERIHHLTTKEPIQGRDLYGNDFTLEPEDGRVRIRLDATPCYLFVKDLRSLEAR